MPRLDSRFLMPNVFLIGLKKVENVDALLLLERDLDMFIIWVDVPVVEMLGRAMLIEYIIDDWIEL